MGFDCTTEIEIWLSPTVDQQKIKWYFSNRVITKSCNDKYEFSRWILQRVQIGIKSDREWQKPGSIYYICHPQSKERIHLKHNSSPFASVLDRTATSCHRCIDICIVTSWDGTFHRLHQKYFILDMHGHEGERYSWKITSKRASRRSHRVLCALSLIAAHYRRVPMCTIYNSAAWHLSLPHRKW